MRVEEGVGIKQLGLPVRRSTRCLRGFPPARSRTWMGEFVVCVGHGWSDSASCGWRNRGIEFGGRSPAHSYLRTLSRRESGGGVNRARSAILVRIGVDRAGPRRCHDSGSRGRPEDQAGNAERGRRRTVTLGTRLS